MRPFHITVSAFGPYAARQEFDMDKLGSCGLYLITGETGAGKTTIFDAITYALFGEASGDSREASMLRSKYAAPDADTFVELTFLYAGKTYTVRRAPAYERAKKHGVGTSKFPGEASLTLPDGSVVSQTRQVNQKIQEILGVNRDQFSQIAMLAQGDFRKLLLAGTRERQEIFRNIFQTNLYQQLQERLRNALSEARSSWDTERSGLRDSIRQIVASEDSSHSVALAALKMGEPEGQDALDMLETLLAEDRAGAAENEAALEAADKTFQDLTQQKRQQEEWLQLISQRDSAAKKAAQLSAQAQACRETLNRRKAPAAKEIETAQSALAALNQVLPKYAELAASQVRRNKLEKEVRDLEHTQASLAQELEALEQQLSARKQRLAELEGSDIQAADLSAQLDRQKDITDRMNAFSEALSGYRKKLQELKVLQDRYLAADTQAELGEKHAKQLRKAFDHAQAGILAEELAEGSPCPVCGSIHHPTPAVRPQSAPNQVQVEQAEADAEALRSTASALQNKCSAASGAARAQKAALTENCQALFGSDQLPETAELRQSIALAAAEQARLEKSLSAQQTLAREKEKLSRDLPELEARHNEAQEKLSKGKEARIAKEAALENAEKELANLQKELNYPDEAAAKQEKNRLEASIAATRKELEDLEHASHEADTAHAAAQGNLETLNAQTEHQGNPEPAEALDAQLEQAVSRKRELTKESNSIATRLHVNQSAKQDISDRQKTLDALETKLKWLGALSDTANGKLSGKKLMLETYVQMHYFDKILARANNQLLKMSSSHYELKRRETADDLRGQNGLELDVVDHYNGSLRSVRTLSGGESFLASLSLALGLSEVIQETAGGIQLDTMFVDEGFGSLDEDTLQVAMSALHRLSDGNRLIGIISHVRELRQEIDKQILVTKSPDGGSHAEIRV